MKKYMPIIESSAILSCLGFMLPFMGATIKSIIVSDIIICVMLILFTASCLYLKKLNYAGYSNIAKWKYIRNLFIYCLSVVLGNVLGYLVA